MRIGRMSSGVVGEMELPGTTPDALIEWYLNDDPSWGDASAWTVLLLLWCAKLAVSTEDRCCECVCAAQCVCPCHIFL